MCTKLKAVHGLVFLSAYLKKIQVQRELFIDEIEHGQETFIPEELG